jgi:hypothetical protein
MAGGLARADQLYEDGDVDGYDEDGYQVLCRIVRGIRGLQASRTLGISKEAVYQSPLCAISGHLKMADKMSEWAIE